MSDYQTPFFLFDLGKVQSRYRRISETFPGASIYYAEKANNHEEVLKTLISLGSKFDIGSRNEAQTVLNLGANPKDVIFSAPVKVQSHIRDTYDMGVNLFVFDSDEELAKLALLAPGSKVMVRLAVSNEGSFFPLSMKFGAPPAQAASLLLDARELGLQPHGIAFHVGSQCMRKETWREAMESSADVMATLEGQGLSCRALDIGGGFPIKYNEDVPSIEEIAEEVYTIFHDRFPSDMKLMIEPGRYVVGESAILVSTVIGRATRGEEEWVFLDASAFHGLLEAQQARGKFPYPTRISHNGHDKKKYVLSGPTCDPDDTILAEAWLPEVKIGDKIYILHTGAYSFVYATNFHGFAPPDIHMIGTGESLEHTYGERALEPKFVPEYDEEKRYVVEQDGEVAKVYFGIKQVPEKWISPLWELYEESFAMEESIQEQKCFDRESFAAALVDTDFVKGILAVDDVPVAFIMGITNVEKLTIGYLNPEFVRNRFPEASRESRFVYIPCLFMSPKLRNAGFVRQMVTALVDAVREKNWIISMDVCDSRWFIPEILEKISGEEGLPLEKHLLGTQSYYAFSSPEPEIKANPIVEVDLSQVRN